MRVRDLEKIIGIDRVDLDEYQENILSYTQKLLGNYIDIKDKKHFTSISIYSLYPLLFMDVFQFSSEKKQLMIHFSHNHFTSLFILDHLYDEDKIENPIELLILLVLYSESRKMLNEIESQHKDISFPEMKQTFQGLYEEKYVYSHPKILSDEDEKKYCYDKYSFAKLALRVYKNNSQVFVSNDVMNTLFISHDYFAYGRQILDDLEDYIDDDNNCQFNIYNNHFWAHYGIEVPIRADRTIFLNLLELSKGYFEAAKKILPSSSSAWYRYIDFYEKIAEENIAKIKQLHHE